MTTPTTIDDATDCPDWPEDFARRYVDAGFWRDATFFDVLAASARRFGEKIALVDAHERVTYADLLRRVERLAAGFLARGVGRGDNVIVQLSNRVAFAEVFFALARIGARPVLTLPAHRQLDIARFCEVATPVAYVTEDGAGGYDYREIARALASNPSFPGLVVIAGDAGPFVPLDTLYLDASPEFPLPDPADVACFQLSGGTTGTPKLIPRRHREYVYNLTASAALCGLDTRSVYLAALPMAHNFPMCCPGFIGTLHAGGTAVLTTDPSPDAVFPLIAREKVTTTALVPPLAMVWLEAVASVGGADLASLELMQIGGAKLGIEAAKRVTATLRCRLQQVFGMAEGLICYTRLDDPSDRILSTQGAPLSPADEVRIVDDDDTDLPVGTVGSLLTRGPYTIRGYYRAAAHNAGAFTADGFYRTGDRARLTPEGYVVVEGRDKDQINRGGEKIAAEEVENLLLAHERVLDAAVVAIPDEALGERICAFVVARDPAPSVIELKRFVRQAGTAAYKVPDRIEYVARFPETGVGKTSRKLLRQTLQAALRDNDAARRDEPAAC